MPRFSRDELVEIRTLVDLGYTVTEIWKQRGQREWNFKSLESAVRRLQQNEGNLERKDGSAARRPRILISCKRVQALVTSPPRQPRTHKTERETHMKAGKFNSTSIAYDFVIE
ncbi:hypothetical protein L596_011776 [Steinernema carpocapsae]|uniref:Uncharacterized protein n=1 Tax=Steinernema carpocapsae TaxID=34508 RepID=A0A4U5NVR5_STECR|nr:hypothetical protein L596_011776 [Steinernema carpocapsae]